jgi:hypothetical protein
MPATIVVGGQYGSEGKGKVVALLGNRAKSPWLVRCGGPNSGHTVTIAGQQVVLRQVPSCAEPEKATFCIAAGCAVDETLILRELDLLSIDRDKIIVDPRAVLINDDDREAEAHMFVGELLHDRIIGALELCCRRGEMLLIQNKRVNWETHQIGIPGATAKDKENRRIPFNPNGRLVAILKRRAALGPDAFVFGSTHGAYQPTIQTAWETLKLLANGLEPRAGEEGVKWNAEQLRRIDLRWHDLRHEGACRLLADGVDIRMIQLMLGHASIQQTQRYLNVTDEELRKGLEVSWGRQLRAVSGGN